MHGRRAVWQSRVIDAATVVLLLAATVLYFDARRGPPQSQAPAVLSGFERDSRLPSVEVTEGGGTRTALLTSDGQTGHLVLFFRTDCPICAQQRPAWEALAAAARHAGWAVSGVTTEPLTEAARGYLGPAIRVVQIDAATADRLRTTVVPTTLAVSATGNVLVHHPGLLSSAANDSVSHLF